MQVYVARFCINSMAQNLLYGLSMHITIWSMQANMQYALMYCNCLIHARFKVNLNFFHDYDVVAWMLVFSESRRDKLCITLFSYMHDINC